MRTLMIAIILLASTTALAVEVSYVDFPKTPVITIRIDDYTKMGEAFGKLAGWAGPRGLIGPNTMFLSIYHANLVQIPENPPRIDAAITANIDYSPSKEMVLGEIGGCKYAKYIYTGPYDKLGEAWHDLLSEVMKNTVYAPADQPSFEVYKNEPGRVKPEELVTEIYLPVEPK
jgi:AraC family transcriptional regulator